MTLKDFRIKARLSQEELADRAGVSQQLISKIERGERSNQTLDTARKLIRALSDAGVSCSVDEVFTTEAPPEPKPTEAA